MNKKIKESNRILCYNDYLSKKPKRKDHYDLDKRKIIDEEGKEGNITIPEFFFPNADGKCFYTSAEEYWDAFQSVRTQYGIQAQDIPMKYMIDSFNLCLALYGVGSEEPVCFPGKKEFQTCIELSGFIESDGC